MTHDLTAVEPLVEGFKGKWAVLRQCQAAEALLEAIIERTVEVSGCKRKQAFVDRGRLSFFVFPDHYCDDLTAMSMRWYWEATNRHLRCWIFGHLAKWYKKCSVRSGG